MVFGELMLLTKFCFIGEGAGLHDQLCVNRDKDIIRDGEIFTLCLFLRVLKHVDVLGDSHGIGVI